MNQSSYHSGCCTVCGFGQWMMTLINHYGIMQGIFTDQKILFILFLPLLSLANDLFTVSIVLFFLKLSKNWNQHNIAFSHRNMHLNFLYLFWCLNTNFFLGQNNIPVSGCAIVYLSIHPLKDILIASKF